MRRLGAKSITALVVARWPRPCMFSDGRGCHSWSSFRCVFVGRTRGAGKILEWGYDYACLMAYDASPTGTLTSAWTALDGRTRRSFWEGANLYVMILRPAATAVRVDA
jgi:hypothetical protein